EDIRLLAIVNGVEIRRGQIFLRRTFAACGVRIKTDHVRGIFDRNGFEEKSLGEREDGGVRANSEGERQHGHGGESRRFDQQPHTVLHVFGEGRHAILDDMTSRTQAQRKSSSRSVWIFASSCILPTSNLQAPEAGRRLNGSWRAAGA